MDPRRLVPALILTAALCLALTIAAVVLRPAKDVAQAHSQPPTHAQRVSAPRRVLAAWDRDRARAWARGDAEALARLYTPTSRVAISDVANLRRWTARGIRVSGLQTQVLAFDVVTQSQSRLVLVVTDRARGGVAVGARGSRELPTDRASTRRLVLVKVSGRWLVSGVRDLAR